MAEMSLVLIVLLQNRYCPMIGFELETKQQLKERSSSLQMNFSEKFRVGDESASVNIHQS